MNIGIIGTNGKSGKRIAAEAIRRGHAVTAIARDRTKLTETGFHNILERDIFSLEETDLRDLDVVVCAVNLKADDENDAPYQRAIRHIITLLGHLSNVRFLMVGGAASLYTEPNRKHQLLEQIPDAWRALPADMAKAYAILQDSDINWTFFSPAFTFDPNGEKTEKYTVGSDYVITNDTNESYISYEDYAIAMVDEIENQFHVRRRFTAVSDSRPKVQAPAGEKAGDDAQDKKKAQLTDEANDAPIITEAEEAPYEGIMDKRPTFYGLSRYRPAPNLELAGRRFKLVMDKETDYFVNFLTGDTLEWSTFTMPTLSRTRYECAKLDDLTYFVNFELPNHTPRTNLTLILDLEQRLLTFVRTYTGFNEKYPYLVESDFDFGAIDVPGFPLPTLRHGYTADLVGKRVNWNYGPSMSIVHVYYSPHYIRATFLPGSRTIRPAQREEMERWPYDEPTTYIKIKEGVYVVSVIEQNRARRGDTGNSLLFLMDLVRVHDVGRSFGHTPPSSGSIDPENYLFAAYGDFVHSDGIIEAQKSVYREE